MEISDVFSPFYEKSEEELLIQQAKEIMARVQAEHPGQPILLREYYSEDELPVMDAYRELFLREDPFLTPTTNGSGQSQDVTTPVSTAPTYPFQPTSTAAPFVAPDPLTRAFYQSAQNTLGKVTGKNKCSPVEATELLLSRVIMRHFEQKFYFFNGSVFQRIPDDQVGSFVHLYLNDLVQLDGSPQLIKNVIALLRTYPTVQVYQTTDHPDQIYFLNGALNISTGKLRPIDPRLDFFTTYVPVEYPQGQSVMCPQMDRFLSTCFGGNEALIETAWEMLGYLLTCDTSAKCFFALVGVGNSGKSVFCRLIDNLFSPGSASYCTPDQLTGRFGPYILKNCRINICAELPYGKISFEFVGLVKAISGNDMRMIEQKFGSFQQLTPKCKFVFASNFDLQIAGADDAFWERVIILPFPFAVPPDQQDKNLLDKLLLESPAIVVKAVEAFKRLRANNYVFPIPRGNTQPVKGVFRHVSEAETVKEFIDKCCDFSDFFTPTSQLHCAYMDFCAQCQVPSITNPIQFSRKLNRLCGDRVTGKKERFNGDATNGYRGIRLRDGVGL